MILSLTVFTQNAVDTYEFRHNGQVYFGAVTEQPDGVMVRFIEDAPWKDSPLERAFRADQVEYFRESSTNRARRHKEGWESRGFVNASRNDGEPFWVPREEAERAEHAVAMAEEQGLLDFPPPPVPRVDAGGEFVDEPSRAMEYWPHALLVLVGLVLVGIVTRTLILPG